MRFPRGPAIGFFGTFGRSSDLRQLDAAFRAVDVHPRMVPEAIKLTMVRLLKDAHGDEPPTDVYRRAAELVGYCMIGANAFAGANDEALADAVEKRIEAALEFTTGLDAKLVLLTLHAKVIQPSVVETFGLASDDAEAADD
jgi:hypothetical protein